MQLAHQAMTTGTILTKRHIYYQHQELFETQRVVDELVDDLAYTLDTDRDNLHITSSSKGSVSGCMIIHLRSGEVVDASENELGTAVPFSRSVSRIEARDARWLLVVEKDAVFRSLVAVRFWETSLAGSGILVTARGYPDLMTRSFLTKIEAECPHLPMLVLSDFDPDGLSIFSCYRYGTTNFSHESSNVRINFGWLGIQSGHLGTLHNNRLASGAGSSAQTGVWSDNCLVNLTIRDRLCAFRMLRKSFDAGDGDFEQILMRRELQIMLMLGTKAEIQFLDDSGDITHWLNNALQKVLDIIY
ncbi:meiotic recombination protein spo11 [Cordyceps militaris CM01]|uniref:DNA topoisomerase (ATP-hydrolyzing) n=1 Tax=Cordyceps militaris (strain CM01) TaxID=983644 RepID=G3JUD0_CORMM|nr:meiotic recombination protein spo11 [Cordyceps militaris CM01]EGX87904.1 meiotic recombination protein spo11 [Cordyceps militaris CM01]